MNFPRQLGRHRFIGELIQSSPGDSVAHLAYSTTRRLQDSSRVFPRPSRSRRSETGAAVEQREEKYLTFGLNPTSKCHPSSSRNSRQVPCALRHPQLPYRSASPPKLGSSVCSPPADRPESPTNRRAGRRASERATKQASKQGSERPLAQTDGRTEGRIHSGRGLGGSCDSEFAGICRSR